LNIEELKNIERKIKACKLCRLHLNRKFAVPGEGNYNAEIMIIGEAPGEEEDKQGRPFVGRAGKVLDKMLEHIGLNRNDVFITNVVKCRPPENREPYDDEAKTCMQNYLEKQIELISPKIILLLGNVATRHLLGVKSVSNVRGKLIEKEGRYYFATYHPAVALYNPSKEETLMKDFELFMNIYNKMKKEKKTLDDFLKS